MEISVMITYRPSLEDYLEWLQCHAFLLFSCKFKVFLLIKFLCHRKPLTIPILFFLQEFLLCSWKLKISTVRNLIIDPQLPALFFPFSSVKYLLDLQFTGSLR